MDAFMSRQVDLTYYISPKVTFYYSMPSVENYWDYGQFLINGVVAETFGESTPGWVYATFDLSGYEGQVITVEWLFHSDGSVYAEGWYIDNILITGVPSEGPLDNKIYIPLIEK